MKNERQKKRKVFLNCGANKGNDILLFREVYGRDYEIFAFEPEPRCFPHLDEFKNINHIKKAIGVTDAPITFHEGKSTASGSLRQDKQTYMSGRSYTVESIDFPKWLLENFTEEDEVVCMWNIEGGEFDIFPSLLSSGAYKIISEFYVELHGEKLTNTSKNDDLMWADELKRFFGDKVYIYNYYQSEKFCSISSEFWNNETKREGKEIYKK